MRRPAEFVIVSVGVIVFGGVLVWSSRPAPHRSQLPRRIAWSAAAEGVERYGSAELSAAAKQQIVASYGRLPLSFEANRGQTDARVKFLSRDTTYTLFLTPTETVLALRRNAGADSMDRAPKNDENLSASTLTSETQNAKLEKGQAQSIALPTASGQVLGAAARAEQGTVLRMKLVGANPAARVAGVDERHGKSNYFIGNDPTKWRTNVPTYAKVKYERVYPGIDLVHYGNQQQLEYDFLVAPGANPETILLSFQGAEGMEIDAQGDLVLHTAAGEIRERRPLVYQETAGVRQAIAASYVLRGNDEVGFAVARYDTSRPLVIDPVLSYSTYLGGNDNGSGIAVDLAGNAYLTGSASSADFPTTSGALQPTFAGGNQDAFVAKLNADGSALVYSTYLGGSGGDFGSGIAVDSVGNAYVTGDTSSTNFPTANPYQATLGGSNNAFVAKLNGSGSTLLYSTYLGGNRYDFGAGVAVDTAGNAYVTGQTSSTNFPTKNPLQASLNGSSDDAFVAKIDTTKSGDASLVYSTYLGGSNFEEGHAIAVDSSGNAYVTGSTQSSNFPTVNPLQASIGGGSCDYYIFPEPCADAFVAKLNPAGSALVFSTYLGGNDDDRGAGIAVDSSGNSYVTGHTSSKNFPTANPIQDALVGFGDAFVAKLNPAGSALMYSTYLGGNNDDDGRKITVDSSGNAYVTGNTSSTDFPTVFPVQVLSGGSHPFITKFNPAGSALVYSSYLGGDGFESAAGIAVDATGNAYVTGYTSSTNFPTANPLQASLRGFSDAFVAKIAPIPGPAIATSPASLTFPPPQPINTTSPPQTVTLTNRGDGTLTVTGITIAGTDSGDFAETNTCGTLPATLAPGVSCAFSVAFMPTATGTRRGTVTISDNAAGSPHTVSLLGNFVPPDFAISASPSAATVSAGGTATSPLTITPLNDFTGSVSLNCSGLPALSGCSFSPNPVPIAAGATSATSTLTISTTAASALLAPPFRRLGVKPLYAACLALLGIGFVGAGILATQPKKRRIGSFSVGLLLVLAALQASCGGASEVNRQNNVNRQPQPGTPPGTYNITVTGTSSPLQRSTTITLTVQ